MTRDISDVMRDAYLEAVAFTEFGEPGEPPKDAQFSALARAQAYIECRDFLQANEDLINKGNCESAAHDLWLTRNGHGTGFFDRPEKWGVQGSDILTRCAKSMGRRDAYEVDDGLIYFFPGA